MAAESTGTWKQKMAFDLVIEGYTVKADADEAFGGEGYGPKPKGLLLTALAGCTGMDVVSILGKMKVVFEEFEVRIKGENAEKHPKVFTKVHIDYLFKGENLPIDKIERAIDLSLNDYCAVAATLKSTAEISHSVIIE